MDGVLGGVSKVLKNARTELDKETAQRASRMTLIVQQAAEEMQPALEQIKLETGRDHSALFKHPPFLAQVAQALLTTLTLDMDAFPGQVPGPIRRWPLDRAAGPPDLFFAQLKLLLARDAQWGPALREFRREAQQAGLNASTLKLIETAEQIAKALKTLPEQTVEAHERREKSAWKHGRSATCVACT